MSQHVKAMRTFVVILITAGLVAAATVTAPQPAWGQEAPEAASYRAGLPLQLEIDPVARQLVPTDLEGAWEALDADGHVIDRAPLAV